MVSRAISSRFLRPARQQLAARHSSTATDQATPPRSNSRWHADLKQRIGKCIIWGCTPGQARKAATVARVLGEEWRSLMAGAEGFLTGNGSEGESKTNGRRGLENHEVAWGEMDAFQHVNNVNYNRWAESSRVNWITHFALLDPANGARWRTLMTPTATGLIMKSIKTDYKMPITYPDRVSVYHKIRHEPRATDTSLVLDCIILSHRHQRVAAKTEEDIVIYDYKMAKKTTIPPFALDVLRDTWRKQIEETSRAQRRIEELDGWVRALEKETWDKDGAVEDLGAAAGKA